MKLQEEAKRRENQTNSLNTIKPFVNQSIDPVPQLKSSVVAEKKRVHVVNEFIDDLDDSIDEPDLMA